VPVDWFPAGWPVPYLAARILTRADLRRRGERPSAKQLAIVEAGLDHIDSPDTVLVHGADDAPEVKTISGRAT
jgi:hypothetical protein